MAKRWSVVIGVKMWERLSHGEEVEFRNLGEEVGEA